MPRDVMTPALTSIAVVVGTIATQFLNNRKAKTRGKVYDRIEEKIDKNHTEIRADISAMGLHLREVETTAVEALHHVVGPDGRGGLVAAVKSIETWQENETMRERDRLQRIADGMEEDRRVGPPERRVMEPRDVGSLNPGGIT